MSLVPIISQTWDTNSVFNPTRMNNIENNIAITATAIEELSNRVTSNLNDGIVDLSSYTSTYYTCPCDGYLIANSNSSTTGVIRAKISDSNNVALAYSYMTVVGDYQIQSTFVKKGMKLNVALNNTNNGTIEFHKLK